MTCPVSAFELFPGPLDFPDNEIHLMFMEAQSIFPPQLFDIFPRRLVKIIPGIAKICAVKPAASESGEFVSNLAPVVFEEKCCLPKVSPL